MSCLNDALSIEALQIGNKPLLEEFIAKLTKVGISQSFLAEKSGNSVSSYPVLSSRGSGNPFSSSFLTFCSMLFSSLSQEDGVIFSRVSMYIL